MTLPVFRLPRPLLMPVVLAGLLLVAAPARSAEPPSWLSVDYRPLVDPRRTCQSGEQVAELWAAVGGPEGPVRQRALDLLEPMMERYAFVMSDALDAVVPEAAGSAPLVEIAGLWAEGAAQPAWVALARGRRIVIESDGAGAMRVIVPAPTDGADPEQAARAAWEQNWGVVRHALAAELTRLAAAGRPARLAVRVHAYRHEVAAARFSVTREPLEMAIESAAPRGDRPPLDLRALERFFDQQLVLEGARLRPDGTLDLFGTPVEDPPTLLGARPTLADLAVAYRAIFHGGSGRPFMSLDRGADAHRLEVHHGGRLADTRLGLVTMLCDVRFKTFSQGIDPWSGADDRARLAGIVPGFATHIERFARAPGAAGITSQQTRFWFYPDAIDLTVSPQGDVLVFRRARMSAASERASGAREAVPPWTAATVDAINETYDRLARAYPELAGLDQVVRLLALFTWLERLDRSGAPVPDLDALLGVELPAVSTPRTFSQQLAFNALPAPGSDRPVDLFNREDVAVVLDRLASPSGRPLPPLVRARRALAALDRRKPEHARAAGMLDAALAADPPPETARLDALSQQAERLVMHRLVLSTLPDDAKRQVGTRMRAGERLRIFSTATGGLDLSMDGALDRARPARSLALTWGGPSGSLPAASRPRAVGTPTPRGLPPSAAPRRMAEPEPSWSREPPGLDHRPLAAHAFPPPPARGAGPAVLESGALLLATGTTKDKGGATTWWLAVGDPWGLRPRARLVVRDASGALVAVVRHEAGRRHVYVPRASGGFVRLVDVEKDLPAAIAAASAAVLGPAADETAPALPAGLAVLELPAGQGDEPQVRLTVSARGTDARPLALPRTELVRVALGPRVDLPPPGRPIPFLVPPTTGLDEAQTVMVRDRAGLDHPPWSAPVLDVPGEQLALRVARALGEWWRAKGHRQVAVAGTSAASPSRWAAAPKAGSNALLLLPSEAFGWPHAALRDQLASGWHAGPTAARLEDVEELPAVVVLASTEPPALLGARLARLAASPRMKGRLLAVYIAGVEGLRDDLPFALLGRGGLAGLGLSEPAVTAARDAAEALAAWQDALAAAGGQGVRVEALAGPFTWIF